MDFSQKAQRLQKYKELAMFLWKYGHDDYLHAAGLDEWLGSKGISRTPYVVGYGSNLFGTESLYATIDGGGRSGYDRGRGVSSVVQPGNHPNAAQAQENLEKSTDLVADLQSLGPTYVRIAQLLAKRPDIIPQQLAEFLSSAQFVQEPIGLVELDATIRAELGLPLSEIYPTFAPSPLTVSPFEQSHVASLRDGRRVIVKVQRPGIHGSIYEDLATLDEVADFCDHHTKKRKVISFRAVVDELKKTISAELDYRQESYNLEHLQQALNELDHIVIPEPVKRYSTARVLTLKFIDGRKLRDSSHLGLLAAERTALAGEIFHAYLKQILVDGFVHGDPNPDNILFTSSGKLALLDLGVVTRVSAAMQEKLLQILVGINEGRGEHVAELLANLCSKREISDEESFRKAIADLVLVLRDAPTDRLEIGRIFIGISQAAFRHGMSLPFEFGTLGTTLVNLDKVADLIDNRFDSRKFLEKNVTEIMKGHVLRTLTPAHVFQNVLEAVDLLEKLPGKVGTILDAVANNQLKITVDAIDEKMLMSGCQKIANRITMGLVLAALIMGATQLMQIKSTFTIWGYPGIAIICFILAAGCGFGLVLEIFISDRKTNQG